MKNICTRIILLSIILCPMQGLAEPPESFVKVAGKAIIHVLGYDKKSFKLYRRSYDNIAFSIYGEGQSEYVTFECDKSVYYDIGTLTASLVGTLSIGLCVNNPLLTKEIIQNQHKYLRSALGNIIKIDESNFERSIIGNGLTFNYFPIYVIGHGIMSAQTSIAMSADARRVLIIQFSGQDLCERLPDLKLCSDSKTALRELSTEILID